MTTHDAEQFEKAYTVQHYCDAAGRAMRERRVWDRRDPATGTALDGATPNDERRVMPSAQIHLDLLVSRAVRSGAMRGSSERELESLRIIIADAFRLGREGAEGLDGRRLGGSARR